MQCRVVRPTRPADGGTIAKKVAGYHQFHATRRAVRTT